ncbi:MULTISPECIES: PhzF family phenazine biosynthesis protein [unclassified Nitrospina]|uniref:PhzF family phenazine biosynthesis protein n=1 Tax=unclassified Nitrospina TaxID=2638683 RepID=UPI003F99BDDD
MELTFYQVDVFTDQPLAGNPLAVFVDAEGLDADQMLAIAREMNLSETTFLFSSKQTDCDFQVRIFTPGKEIPFAGHPTLGTAHVLFQHGFLGPDRNACRFEMGVGPVNVTREGVAFMMEQPQPEIQGPRTDRQAIAQALGLDTKDLHPDLPAQVVSTGFPALLVPLKSLDPAGRIALNLTRLRGILGDVDMIYPFCLETVNPSAHVHTRGFAPFIGIPEDPATGSVAGAMGAYLAQHQVLDTTRLSELTLEQGLEINRPSEIKVSVKMTGGQICSIRVGGKARTVAEGRLFL